MLFRHIIAQSPTIHWTVTFLLNRITTYRKISLKHKNMRDKRPPFPHVWTRFEIPLSDGTVIKYRIEDCPEERFQELADFMVEYFMRDETWNKSIGIENEERAIEEFLQLQIYYLPEKLSQICVVDDESERPEIAGFNILTISNKDSDYPEIEIKSKAMTKLFEMFREMEEHNDVFQRYGVDTILGDAGLSVSPKHRGRGIARQLLRTRRTLADALDLKVIAATFTSTASQTVAEREGYETYYQIDYKEFGNKMNVQFQTDSPYLKIMANVAR